MQLQILSHRLTHRCIEIFQKTSNYPGEFPCIPVQLFLQYEFYTQTCSKAENSTYWEPCVVLLCQHKTKCGDISVSASCCQWGRKFMSLPFAITPVISLKIQANTTNNKLNTEGIVFLWKWKPWKLKREHNAFYSKIFLITTATGVKMISITKYFLHPLKCNMLTIFYVFLRGNRTMSFSKLIYLESSLLYIIFC